MALRNLGIDHEVVAISDVDEFTVKSYTAIHDNDKLVSQATDEEMQDYLEKRNIPLNSKGGRKILKGNKLREFYEACIKSNNLGDISKVETQNIPDHDLFTYSFPCQDISVAGKGLGLNEGSDTRSGLLWECQKVIDGKRPKYLLLENVKNLVGQKHKHNFDKWLEWLEEQGYTNYWQVLNAKDYGVPQNRERVFVVSILGEHEPYEFPEPIELELRLKDVLESEVDEKFYLSKEKSEKLISRFDLKDEPFLLGGEQKNQAIKKDGISTTLTSSMGTGGGYVPMVNRIGGIFDKDGKTHQAGAVWDKEGLSPTLDTMQGGWRQPSVVIGASRGRNPENTSDRTVGSPTEQRLEINKQGTSNTITTVQKDNYVVYNNLRIRKLTPKECWRLMGFSDEDFHKAESVNSNSQLYKQAGNSIVVDVLEGIFNQLFDK